MDVRLVAVDLDDCLLGTDGGCDAASVAALDALAEQGIGWCVATGRSAGRVAGLVELLRPSAGWIMAHGARCQSGDWSRTVPLAPYDLAELAAMLELDWPEAVMAVDRDDVIYHDPGYPLPERAGRRSAVVDRDTMALWSPDMVRVWDDRVAELPEAIEERGLGLRCWAVGPGDYLELTAPGATKAAALQCLAEELGLAASQVAAIGDGHSDAGMLVWAGRGVTLPWAHPAALGAADMVAEGGFGAALRLAVA